MKIEGTKKSPTVILDSETGILQISGRSVPENASEFYSVIYDWIKNYSSAPQKQTVLNVTLEYFNTQSAKCVMDVFLILQRLFITGHDVQINWYYEKEDEDMQECGDDFKSLLSVPFHVKCAE